MARIRITIEIDTDEGDQIDVKVAREGEELAASVARVTEDGSTPQAFSASAEPAPGSHGAPPELTTDGLLDAIGIGEGPISFGGPDPAEARAIMGPALEAIREETRDEADLEAIAAALAWLEEQGDAEAIERVTRYVLGEEPLPEDAGPLSFAGVAPLEPEELQRGAMLGVPRPEDFSKPPRGWYKSKEAAAQGLRDIFAAEEAAGARWSGIGEPSLDTWFSYVGGSDVPDAGARPPSYKVRQPETLAELKAELSASDVSSARVVGGSHNSSTIAYPPPGQLLLNLRDFLDNELAPGVAGTRPDGRPTLVRDDAEGWGAGWHRVRVPAGISVERVKAAMPAGLMFDQLGGYDQQTLWGAMCTGTHGSGMGQGPLCDYLCSVDMMVVLPDGSGGRRVRPLRIEASDGPSDPAAFAADPRLSDWILVQDDDFFDAVRVSFGCMGVVFALSVWVRSRYGLREHRNRDKARTSALQDEIQAAFDELEHRGTHGGPVSLERFQLEYVVNAYARNNGKHGFVRNTRTVIPYKDSLAGRRDQPSLLKNQKKQGPSATAKRVWKTTRPSPLGLGPHAFMSLALSNTAHKEPIDFKGQDALYLGVGRWATAPASEVAFPAARVGEAVRALAKKLDRLFDRKERYRLTSPYGLRFVRPSRALLAPQTGSPPGSIDAWAMIECASPLGLPGQEKVLAACEHVLVGLGGRPHWGQTHAADGSSLDRFPAQNVKTWLAVLQALDPSGFFDNAFTEKIGVRLRAQWVEARVLPGAALVS